MQYNMFDLPEYELLSSEETNFYIKMAQKGNNDALEKIVEHNLKLVLKVAYRFKNSNYELQDIFQIGIIGLIKAIKGFDFAKNVKFSTYAVSRIIGEIRLYIRDDGLIKVSRSLKKAVFIVKQKEEELKNDLKRPPTIGELSEATSFSKEEIVQAFEASKSPASIYQVINSNEDEGNPLFLIDSIKEKQTDYEKLELLDAINKLDERARKIIFLRYFQDMTQQEIAKELNISQVQVSRLEKKILAELKECL